MNGGLQVHAQFKQLRQQFQLSGVYPVQSVAWVSSKLCPNGCYVDFCRHIFTVNLGKTAAQNASRQPLIWH